MPGFAQGLWEALARDFHLVLPQVFLMVAATLMLWPGDLLVAKDSKGKWALPTALFLLVAGGLALWTAPGEGFSGMYKVDGLTKGFQLLSVLGSLAAVVLSQKLLNGLREQTVEFYALILFAASGMLFLCGATDLVSIYFAVELMSLCLYILAAYLRTQNRGVEAGLKYYLLGAFSSAIFIYGISLIFAAAGSTNLAFLGAPGPDNPLLKAINNGQNLLVFSGVLMVLVAMCFKVAAVPFHMWSPDVYDGSPTPITLFFTTAPKAAALAAFLRVFGVGFHGILGEWSLPLQFVAGASMILGNVAAIKQQSMKRLLAYSSIAHIGYMLLGVLSGIGSGAQAVWLYMLVYVVMNTGAFAIVIYLQGQGEGERIEDFKGLGRKRPMVAFAMLVFLLSLAGIPPLAGFFSKFYLFKLAVEQGFTTLVVIALLTSAVSAFYYLGVVKEMYFSDSEGEAPALGGATMIVVGATTALVLVGTAFGPVLLDWAGRIGL